MEIEIHKKLDRQKITKTTARLLHKQAQHPLQTLHIGPYTVTHPQPIIKVTTNLIITDSPIPKWNIEIEHTIHTAEM